MKIHTHTRLAFAIVLLSLAHLQMKRGATSLFFDPEIIAGIVIIVMGSVFFGTAKPEKSEGDLKSPFLERDDHDLSA